jgi:hypothetical protein
LLNHEPWHISIHKNDLLSRPCQVGSCKHAAPKTHVLSVCARFSYWQSLFEFTTVCLEMSTRSWLARPEFNLMTNFHMASYFCPLHVCTYNKFSIQQVFGFLTATLLLPIRFSTSLCMDILDLCPMLTGTFAIHPQNWHDVIFGTWKRC